MVIAAEVQKRIGICFTDVCLNSNSPHWQIRPDYNDDYNQSFTNKMADELWLVMVCEKAVPTELVHTVDFAGSLLKSYNQFFLLDFHNYALHRL